MAFKNTFFHLVAFPGVGKYTIAKVLQPLVDAKIVDNHLINNALFSLIDLNAPALPDAIWQQTQKVREAVFHTIETMSPMEYNFIFTNAINADDTYDQNILNSVMNLAAKRNATYIPVRLSCDQEENIKRFTDTNRSNRLKPTNEQIIQRRIERNVQLIDIPHANLLNLDITHLSPEQTAEIILQHAASCSPD